MDTPDRRHRHVINVDEADGAEKLTGSRFGFRFRGLAEPAGGRGIGASWYEVPPGRAAFPFHFHCLNEEAMFVLEGQGTLRIGQDRIAIRAGDWISFPVGPDTAHQVINTGTAPLRLLALSTKINGDVVGYPDSKKLAATASPPGAGRGDKPWIRVLVQEGTSVDYFYGEKLD
jgi:uncharacterized cupin superfamily protein